MTAPEPRFRPRRPAGNGTRLVVAAHAARLRRSEKVLR